MLKFFIDIFCKDTIIGLSDFEDIRRNCIYKNQYKNLFCTKEKKIYPFIGQIVYHL